MRYSAATVLLMILALLAPVTGFAQVESFGRSYALVIGIDRNENFDVRDSLPYPSKDARGMAALLRERSTKMGAARHQMFIFDACFGGLFAQKASMSQCDPTTTPDFVSRAARQKARQYLTAGAARESHRAQSAGMARTADAIKIAVVGPFTGPLAQYGEMQKIGAEMAVEQINAAGGVAGMMLEAVMMDDVCKPKQAAAVANKVVNDGIKFVVGHLCSDTTQAASEIYEAEGILMITPASTNPAITERGFKLVFRTIGLDSQQGSVAGRFIAEKMKPTNMAVIHDKQQYGQGIAEAVKATVEDAGVNVVLFEGVSWGQTDFSALITKMKQANVDFVYYGGYHPELGLILRQSKKQGFDAPYMGPEGVGNKDISAIAGEASEGLLVTLPADFAAVTENGDLVQAFKGKGEDPSGPFVMPAYSAVQIIADTIEASGDQDTEAMAKAMRGTTYLTPIGEVAFDGKGDLKEFNFVVFEWHADATKTAVQ